MPDLANPQALNRYSYALNNPIRYTDPSGHGVDCGIGMGCVKDPTPGMIMADAIHQRIKREEDSIVFMLTTKEIEQINDYMNTHSNYNPMNDQWFVSAKPAQRWFSQARLDYWKEVVPWPPKERMNYMKYYDFNQTVIAYGFDPSRVSWGNVLLDVAGIPLGFAGLGEVSSGVKLSQFSDDVVRGLGGASFLAAYFTAQTREEKYLAIGSAVPIAGGVFSTVALLNDIGKGFYEYEWLP